MRGLYFLSRDDLLFILYAGTDGLQNIPSISARFVHLYGISLSRKLTYHIETFRETDRFDPCGGDFIETAAFEQILTIMKYEPIIYRIIFIVVAVFSSIACLAQVDEYRLYQGHGDWVVSVAYSSDGLTFLSGSNDGYALLRDIETGETVQSFYHARQILSSAYSPTGDRFLTVGVDNTIALWDLEREIIRIETTLAWSTAFSPDGSRFLTGHEDGSVVLWETDTGETIRTYNGHTRNVYSVAFSPDGNRLLSGSDDGTGILWDTESGEILQTFPHSSQVMSVAFSLDGTQYLTGAYGGKTTLWDSEGRIYTVSSGAVWSVAFSPDGNHFLTGCDDGTVILRKTETGDIIHMFDSGAESVYAIAFSPDGQSFLAGCNDGTVKAWDLDGLLPVRVGLWMNY